MIRGINGKVVLAAYGIVDQVNGADVPEKYRTYHPRFKCVGADPTSKALSNGDDVIIPLTIPDQIDGILMSEIKHPDGRNLLIMDEYNVQFVIRKHRWSYTIQNWITRKVIRPVIGFLVRG